MIRNISKSCLAYLPAVLVAAGIAVVCLAEQRHVPQVSINDKLVHGLMYFVLSACLMVGMLLNGKKRWTWWGANIVSCTLYGLLIEILQHCCTLTRSCEMADLFADFVGALIGLLLVWTICQISRPFNP